MKEPSANSSNPMTMIFLRPYLSDAAPSGIWPKDCVKPYMPSAKPTKAALLPPGKDLACTEKTGRIKNKPSMRNAKMEASEVVVRISLCDMRELVSEEILADISTDKAGIPLSTPESKSRYSIRLTRLSLLAVIRSAAQEP